MGDKEEQRIVLLEIQDITNEAVLRLGKIQKKFDEWVANYEEFREDLSAKSVRQMRREIKYTQEEYIEGRKRIRAAIGGMTRIYDLTTRI